MEGTTIGWPILFAVTLAAITIRSALAIGVAFAWASTSSFAQRRRIYRLAYADGQIITELKAAMTVLVFDAVLLSATRYFGLIRFDTDPSLPVSIFTFAALFVWIEIWFYVTHRAMHRPSLFWIHRQHHTAKVTDPLTSLSFSLMERGILLAGVLAFAALVSLAIPLGAGALVTIGVANYVLNVLGHSNVEFMPEWFARSRVGVVFITPSYHSLHHARFRGHYGLFTTVLDRWFDTAFDDYEEVYDRARAGEGLTRLGERVGTPADRRARRSKEVITDV